MQICVLFCAIVPNVQCVFLQQTHQLYHIIHYFSGFASMFTMGAYLDTHGNQIQFTNGGKQLIINSHSFGPETNSRNTGGELILNLFFLSIRSKFDSSF